ncbi:MAG: hypothetical protein IJL92_03770, partial [Thermoguttaceae bacterium]|nr:hypothetical protein [Thermoguttaceae bacterium]
AYADEETSLTTALLARKSGLANDYGTYLTALSVAATQYSDRVNLNDQVYSYHQERIDHFNATVALSGIFTNPTFDYEVCFVAGTPVLMADGSRRAIETLRPGDLVLAADQLNPESAPAPAMVVRFFDNGEQTVVRLRFEVLVCTPEHPFYVLGKGWVCAEELVEGDLCLNAKGESVAFISREELAETRRVYNIEVEGAHTYFVGDDGVVSFK